MFNDINTYDNTEQIELWHRNNGTCVVIDTAILRRFRHRTYSAVKEKPVPENHGHWYFAVPPEFDAPQAGDEIVQDDESVWTIVEVNGLPFTSLWQCVCVSYSNAAPTEFVDVVHPAEADEPIVIQEHVPARAGRKTEFYENGEKTERVTMYLKGFHTFENGDFIKRNGNTYWGITKTTQPLYRNGWTAAECER